MTTVYDDDDEDDVYEPELKRVIDSAKHLNNIYSTDIFDDVITNRYMDYDDLGRLILDMRLLTADDRENFLQLVYELFDAEMGDWDVDDDD